MVQRDTDEIFREVDEELRKERFEQLWKDYSVYIAAAAVAIVLGVGGWKLTEHLQAKRAAEAGARFNSALLLLESKKTEDAEKVLRELSTGGQGGYRTLAGLRLGAIEAANGNTDTAVKAFDAIAADSGADSVLRGLASIKAAMLRSGSADWTEMQNRLTPLKDVKNPWHASARELLGLAAWKAGKLAEAEQEYQALVESRTTPGGIKQRAEMMLALILDAAKAPAAATIEVVPKAAEAPAGVPATAPPQGGATEKSQPSPAAAKSGTPKATQK